MSATEIKAEVDQSENTILKRFKRVEDASYYKKYQYFVDKQTRSGLTITEEPTGNCQILSIGYFLSLLNNFTDQDIRDFFFKRDEAKLSDFTKMCGFWKPNILIDVPADDLSTVETIFKDRIILFKTPYKNTTGNNMIMILINIA